MDSAAGAVHAGQTADAQVPAAGMASGGTRASIRDRILRVATPQFSLRAGRVPGQPAHDGRLADLDVRARIVAVATPLRAEAGAARRRRDARSRSRPRLLLAAAGA